MDVRGGGVRWRLEDENDGWASQHRPNRAAGWTSAIVLVSFSQPYPPVKQNRNLGDTVRVVLNVFSFMSCAAQGSVSKGSARGASLNILQYTGGFYVFFQSHLLT